jgi:hypothetical protein
MDAFAESCSHHPPPSDSFLETELAAKAIASFTEKHLVIALPDRQIRRTQLAAAPPKSSFPEKGLRAPVGGPHLPKRVIWWRGARPTSMKISFEDGD